jgi:cytochrome b pre-mRNA-processing protein 3
MTLLERLFRPKPDASDAVRPLWQAVVAEAREPRWYRECGVADSVEGRFDMVTLVLALVLLRLESEAQSADASVRLTELFVSDMDAQLRQSGVGDLMVGKHVGKLMAVLGGRLGSLRDSFALGSPTLAEVAARNVTLNAGGDAEALAAGLRALHARLAALPSERLLEGRLAA